MGYGLGDEVAWLKILAIGKPNISTFSHSTARRIRFLSEKNTLPKRISTLKKIKNFSSLPHSGDSCLAPRAAEKTEENIYAYQNAALFL